MEENVPVPPIASIITTFEPFKSEDLVSTLKSLIDTYIVVCSDDNSVEQCKECIKEFFVNNNVSKPIHFYGAGNGHLGIARNTAVNNLKNNKKFEGYCLFGKPGDIYSVDSLAKMLGFISSHNTVSLVYSDFNLNGMNKFVKSFNIYKGINTKDILSYIVDINRIEKFEEECKPDEVDELFAKDMSSKNLFGSVAGPLNRLNR